MNSHLLPNKGRLRYNVWNEVYLTTILIYGVQPTTLRALTAILVAQAGDHQSAGPIQLGWDTKVSLELGKTLPIAFLARIFSGNPISAL